MLKLKLLVFVLIIGTATSVILEDGFDDKLDTLTHCAQRAKHDTRSCMSYAITAGQTYYDKISKHIQGIRTEFELPTMSHPETLLATAALIICACLSVSLIVCMVGLIVPTVLFLATISFIVFCTSFTYCWIAT